MSDFFQVWNGIPNLHPVVIHLPLGLLPVAFVFDLVVLLRRDRLWLDWAASSLYVIGALGAGVSVWAGERAQDSLRDVPPLVQPLISRHSDWGHYVWYIFGVLAMARVAISWMGRREARVSRLGVRVVLVIGALVGLLVLARTADFGGALVYRSGLAVTAVAAPAEVEIDEPDSSRIDGVDASVRLSRAADGSLEWRPRPGDAAALEAIFEAVQGTTLETVKPAPAGDTSTGVSLSVEGRTVLRFPGDLGDLQIDAEFELGSFEGTVGLAHHLAELDLGGFLLLRTTGSVSLVDVRNEEQSTLDDQPLEVPVERFTLSVSSAGRHLKGMVDGETVVHGHIEPLGPGGAGLVLNGSGVVWIHSVRVTSLDGV